MSEANKATGDEWENGERAEAARDGDSAPASAYSGPAATPTIREAWLQASSFLRDSGVEDAASSAEWLLEYILGWTRSDLFMRWNEPFPVELRERWDGLLKRRALGEPVQYVTGEQQFYGLPFRVTPAVLIPRPETELLVEKAIEIGNRLWPSGSPLAADIGCGSGAIAVALAVRCSPWNITATDISPDAVEVAKGNAALNGVGERIRLFCGDLLEAYIRAQMPVDIVLSNPPYIETTEIPRLQREVRLHEPTLALDGGPDGLLFYRRILEQIAQLPAPPALIGFELGQGQARQVEQLLHSSGYWDETVVVPDLAGIERHVLGWKNRSKNQ